MQVEIGNYFLASSQRSLLVYLFILIAYVQVSVQEKSRNRLSPMSLGQKTSLKGVYKLDVKVINGVKQKRGQRTDGMIVG